MAVPLRPGEWLAERRARLDTRLKEFGRAARTGTIPGGIIENGKLHIDKLRADKPEGAQDLVLDLYQQLPPARITALLLEVEERTGFHEAFTHPRHGAHRSDRIRKTGRSSCRARGCQYASISERAGYYKQTKQ